MYRKLILKTTVHLNENLLAILHVWITDDLGNTIWRETPALFIKDILGEDWDNMSKKYCVMTQIVVEHLKENDLFDMGTIYEFPLW